MNGATRLTRSRVPGVNAWATETVLDPIFTTPRCEALDKRNQFIDFGDAVISARICSTACEVLSLADSSK